MVDFRIGISELAERIGGEVADFSDQVAEETRKFACEIWNAYPGYITNNHSLGTSVARGFFQKLCAPNNPPPPDPPSELMQGQCDGVSYRVDLIFANNGADPCNNQGLINAASLYVTGKVDGLRMSDTGSIVYSSCDTNFTLPPSHPQRIVWLSSKGHTSPDSTNQIIFVVDYAVGDMPALCQIVHIERLDGLADNCGTPGGYPVAPVPPPEITKNITINIDNDTTINLNPTVKRREPGNNFTFPLVFGYADFDVSLDLGGFTFSPTINVGDNSGGGNGNGNPPPPPINNGNQGDGNGSGGGGNGGGGNGGGRPAPSPFNPDFYDVTPLPDEEEPKMDNIENLAYITIEVKAIPSNAKTENGAPGDDIYYPGFVAFRAGEHNYPRQPLHYSKNILRAPEGADGFAARRYPGFSFVTKVYTRKEGT